MKKFLMMVMICCLFCLPVPAAADDAADVEKLLKTKTDAVLTLLKDAALSDAAKQDRIMEMIGPIIDFELMAKLTLGKTNWGLMNPKQQQDFVELFVARLKHSYLEKASFYDDEKIIYKPGTQHGNKVHVPVGIISKDKPIELKYKFYQSGDRGWMAYDVEINGVSLIRSYQSQFSEIMKNGTPEDLLKSLQKPVEDPIQ